MAFHTFGPALVRDRRGPLAGRLVRVLDHEGQQLLETFTTGADPQPQPVVADTFGYVPQFSVDSEHLMVWLEVGGQRKLVIATEVFGSAAAERAEILAYTQDLETAVNSAATSAGSAATSAGSAITSAGEAATSAGEASTDRQQLEALLEGMTEFDFPLVTSTSPGLIGSIDKSSIDRWSEYVIDVRRFGAIPDGVTDNTQSFNDACSEARESKARVYVPAGRWKVGGLVDISGVHMHGDFSGYQNRNGSIIVGGAPLTFSQEQTSADLITMGLHKLRFEDCVKAVQMTYTVQSHISDVHIIEASSDAFTLGINTIIGPIWNHMERCHFSSAGGRALVLGGKDWHNNTITDDCDFKGSVTHAAVEVNVTGGYGALNNIFNGTELRGGNVGLKLSSQNGSTTLNGCYCESHGPAVWIAGTSRNLMLNGGIYGTTNAENPTGVNSYIHHASGTTSLRFMGAWITAGADPKFNDLRLITSAAPGSLAFRMTQRPVVNVAASGWKLYDELTVSEESVTTGGNLAVAKAAVPTLGISYADGSRVFDIRRNGTQNGPDYGVFFRENGTNAFWIDSGARTRFLAPTGFMNYTTANRPVASTAGAGAVIYDSTLGKIIMSNGSGWRNLDGTAL